MSKYGNRKMVVDNITFDSRAEAARYGELKLLQQAGQISQLRLQPRYELLPAFISEGKTVRKVVYIADFEYLDSETGWRIVEDVKGGKATQTAVFKLKAKLFKHRYPGKRLRIVEMS